MSTPVGLGKLQDELQQVHTAVPVQQPSEPPAPPEKVGDEASRQQVPVQASAAAAADAGAGAGADADAGTAAATPVRPTLAAPNSSLAEALKIPAFAGGSSSSGDGGGGGSGGSSTAAAPGIAGNASTIEGSPPRDKRNSSPYDLARGRASSGDGARSEDGALARARSTSHETRVDTASVASSAVDMQRKNLERHAKLQSELDHLDDEDASNLSVNVETAYGGYRKELAARAAQIARSPAKLHRFEDDGQGGHHKDPVLGMSTGSNKDEGHHVGVRVVQLLCVLGFVAALLNFAIEEAVHYMHIYKSSLIHRLELNGVAHFFAYFAWILVLVLAGCSWVVFFAPQASGSGIPEMKTMMAGDGLSNNEQGWAKGYLSFRTGLSKMGGLIFALGAGLFIGREGPFVHLSCIVAKQLMRLPKFDIVNRSRTLRPQILAAACAVGVSTSFGCPIGGVLFSIEVTATYYLVSSYWKSFVAAMTGAVSVRLVQMAEGLDFGMPLARPFFQHPSTAIGMPQEITPDMYQLHGLLAAVVVGVLCGFASAAFVNLVDMVLVWKKNNFGKPLVKKGDKGVVEKDGKSEMRKHTAATARVANGGKDFEDHTWFRKYVAPKLGIEVIVAPPFRGKIAHWLGMDADGGMGRKKKKKRKQFFDLGFIFLTVMLTALIRFPGANGKSVELPPVRLLLDLFAANKSLPSAWSSFGIFGKDSAVGNLADVPVDAVGRLAHDTGPLMYMTIVYMVLAAFSVTLPVPSGVFIPSFACGAAIGRFVALVFDCIPFLSHSGLDAGAFAVVGAGAMAGGVTRTISASVLTLEMTGQFHHALPSFLAVFVCMGTSQMLRSPSIYDLILKKKVPFALLRVVDFPHSPLPLTPPPLARFSRACRTCKRWILPSARSKQRKPCQNIPRTTSLLARASSPT